MIADARPTRGNLMSAVCPSRIVANHLTSRWGALAVLGLQGKTRRFGQLRREIGGISEQMLAKTLQALEGDGLVNRVAHDVIPPHVEYSLTALGEEAAERVRALADWIETSLPKIGEEWEKRGPTT